MREIWKLFKVIFTSKKCPYCGSKDTKKIDYNWEWIPKKSYESLMIEKYKCLKCGRSF